MSDIQDEAYTEAMIEIQDLKLLVYKLACELRIYHRLYGGRGLVSPKIDDLLKEAFSK